MQFAAIHPLSRYFSKTWAKCGHESCVSNDGFLYLQSHFSFGETTHVGSNASVSSK
nr:MAG TPA: hypothetical protein [Caudoviricetes sp.]